MGREGGGGEGKRREGREKKEELAIFIYFDINLYWTLDIITSKHLINKKIYGIVAAYI